MVQDSSSPCRTEAPSAAPATQNEPEVLQVLHLPRKTSWRGSKCCACHAKTKRRPTTLPQTSMEGAPSAAPATQNEPEVLQVLHLPRKTSRRCSKCCACHAKKKRPKVINCCRTSAPAMQNGPRCSKCPTFHAKRAGGACHAKGSGAQSNQLSPL